MTRRSTRKRTATTSTVRARATVSRAVVGRKALTKHLRSTDDEDGENDIEDEDELDDEEDDEDDEVGLNYLAKDEIDVSSDNTSMTIAFAYSVSNCMTQEESEGDDFDPENGPQVKTTLDFRCCRSRDDVNALFVCRATGGGGRR